MTEDFSVKQRPSAAPYFLGGAAVGAAGGYFVDKLPGGFKGVTKAKYASFDDILKEKKDFFTKTEDMSADLKKAAEAIEAKKNEVITFIKDNAKNTKFDDKVKAEGEAVAAKAGELKSAFNTAIESVKQQISEGKIEALKDTKPEEIEKAARKYVKEHINEDQFRAVKDAITAKKEATKKLVEKAKAEGVDAHKVIDGLKDQKTKAWDAIKDEAAKFKSGNKWANVAIGAAALALVGLALRPKSKE